MKALKKIQKLKNHQKTSKKYFLKTLPKYLKFKN